MNKQILLLLSIIFLHLSATEEHNNVRIIRLGGMHDKQVSVALGYKDTCLSPYVQCCPKDQFMRYELLDKSIEAQDVVYHVPDQSKYGKYVCEIAIKTSGAFWEFYIPIEMLPREETVVNFVEIKKEIFSQDKNLNKILQEIKIVLSNSCYQYREIFSGR